MSDSRASLRGLVNSQAGRNPAAVAIAAPGRLPLTYGGLRRQVGEVVERLNALGIGRNDRVAMVLPEGPELAVAFIAIASGATCAPLNPEYRAAEFDLQLAHLHCRALLVQSGSVSPAIAVARSRGIPVLELVPAPEAEAGRFALALSFPGSLSPHALQEGFSLPDDLALVLHTSGTAARPKLVPLTHRNLCASAETIRAAVELVEGDRCLNVMPLFHIHGLSALFASMAAGASVVCAGRFAAPQFFQAMQAFHPTWYTAAPTIHRELLAHALLHPDALARSSLRFIRSASAPMPRQLIADMERVFGVPFVEAYGMTEASPQIASNRLRPGRRKPGSVGLASGPDVAVMDEAGNLLPPGEAGEVVVRGPNVIPAYENDAEANGSAFVRGWFRTGDCGHLDPEGFLFITGRLKEIINRGGEKISPREVDEVLLDHPAIAEAVTFPVPHPTLGEDVAAAIVLTPGVHPDAGRLLPDIRRFSATRLSHFKVPQLIVILDQIPVGPTGKVRRMELAGRLDLLTPASRRADFTAPRTTMEEQVSRLWAGVLGIESPGVHDNFFQLGGDSLRAAQVSARLAGDYRIEVPPHRLFECPTVAELAHAVANALEVRGPAAPLTIARSTASEASPLSFAQRRLWLLDQIEPGNPAYNMLLALSLRGKLSEDALERSLGEIRRRHETLRTTIQVVAGEPVQVVSPVQPLRLPVVDLTRLPGADRQAEALRLAAEEGGRPFNLVHGPLFRVTLLRLGAEEHVLLLTVHHIVSDGWSTAVLSRELEALYPAFAAGGASPLAELPIQYADFSLWQRQWLQGELLEAQLEYWRHQLAGMPQVLELPADRPRSAQKSHRGASYSMELSATLSDGLHALSRRESATPFMTLLAAFQTLLHRYSGQTDFAVGTPIANRTRLETEGLIGFFANTLVMRADLSDTPTFADMLRRVRSTSIDAFAHQDLPFERLVEELHPGRVESRNPLFQVMFVFQNLPGREAVESFAGLTATPIPVARERTKFDLTLYLTPTGQGLTATWQYDTDLFDADRIVRMAGHFRVLLEGIVENPDSPLSQLPLLAAAERRRLLTTWNSPEQSTSGDRCFHHLFERQVESTPDAPAVQCGADRLSYRELNLRANHLARRLQEMGVGPETPVGVLLDRSIAMVVAILAVMKAGGAWVPLDPAYPEEHLAFLQHDAGLAVLVTERRLLSKACCTKVLCLDADPEFGAGSEEPNPVSAVTGANLAYLIYTSGSTGKPKGVMITHANLAHYVQSLGTALGITAADCWLHTASFAFSSSVRQLLLPLSCGARVAIAETDALRNPEALFRLVGRQEVTVIDLVPSYWRICGQALAPLPPGRRAELLTNHLRLILSASEPLTSDLSEEWLGAFPDGVRMINMFGQTETAGIVTLYPVSPRRDGSTTIVPIGRPIGNTRAYVLDASRQPVPIGVWGELYIGGAGVGRGYRNDPGLTAESFLSDPFSPIPGARLYRTGDVTRYLPDGNLEFRGRVDHQIKIRGYRIEPGQIEAVIARASGWREAAVMTEPDAAGAERLVAYVVPNRDGEAPTADLVQSLKQKLPGYMIPSRIVRVPALPRTPNGKVDRSALRELADSDLEPAGTPVLRATGVEALLTALWCEVLGVDRVSADDNFFDIGGNSILAIRMITRANQSGLVLTPKQLWQHQTIGELARALADPGVPVAVPEPVARRAPVETESGRTTVRVSLESLRAWGSEALRRAGLAEDGAAIVTEVQLEASLRDQPTHNIGSIPRYARRIAAGTINPRPDIRIERTAEISAYVDGDNGPGQWVAVLAMEAAIGIAREKGLGIVAVRGSNHLGAAGHYPWMATREGLIGLCTTNGPVILAPTGGVTPTFGNNPLGVGIPANRYHPILLDIAMSVAPRGRIGLKLAEGMALPPGWILDRNGRPSTDPADLVAGLGVPIGGHKGYGLTLVMEVLAGVLTGANFGWDNRREHTPHMVKPANFGHFFMAIDPELFLPAAEFTTRVDRLIEQAKTGERADGVEEILIPGESELRARERSLREGVSLRASTYQALRKYARSAGLETKLVLLQ